MHHDDYILIVDDDTEDHMILQLYFEDRGLSDYVMFIDKGKNALEFLTLSANSHTLPKLVVLDLNMPMMNGAQMLDCIRHTPGLHDVPVIILSTSENERERRHILELGAVDYLIKPITLDEGRALVDKFAAFIDTSAPNAPR